jgi:hypothetical protein
MRTAIISAIITLLVVALIVLVLVFASARKGEKRSVKRAGDFLDITVRLPLPWLFSGAKPKANKIIYINREGATLRGGGDDATNNRATLAGTSIEDSIDVPAWRGSYSRWAAVMKCLRKAFAPYDVEIVERRPVDSDYLMVLFGGHPKLLKNRVGKAHLRATGMAPHNGLAIHNAVVLVFTRFMKESTRRTCETAAHEIAHAYGLDHGYNCRDFMTYLGYCGTKRFVDKEIPCGEKKKRKCHGGASLQNSHQDLLKVLGARTKG